jgi:hypothetical protein
MWNALSYYWMAAKGYRLHPWHSPYLKWRMETFLGKEAENLSPVAFLAVLWKYRHNLQRFADWAAERRRAQANARS